MKLRLRCLVMGMGCISPALAATTPHLQPHSADREALLWRTAGAVPTGMASQRLPDGTTLAYVPRLAAGQTSAPNSNAGSTASEVRWKTVHGAMHAMLGNHDLLAFHGTPVAPPRPDVPEIYTRSGFIDPIRTRAGVVVTESFSKMPPKHEHYYGLWSAWTATEFEGRPINFWDVRGGNSKVRCREVGKTWAGPIAGGFTAVNEFTDLSVSPGKPVLNETWHVVAYAIAPDAPYALFDISLHQTCATSSPVTFKQYRYGGMAIKFPEAIHQATKFMVSTGETDREKANHTRQRWVYMGGTIDGREAGIALLSHPQNFRAPETVRLHPQTPFFCFSPATPGEFELTPDKPYQADFRVVVLDGVPDRSQIDRLWNAFASVPPPAAPPATKERKR